MGCFSYMCKKCGTSVRSISFNGEYCTLYFLVEGKIVEEMRGRYDSYGRVFKGDDSYHKLYHPNAESSNPEQIDTSIDSHDWKYAEWGEMVGMHFEGKNDTGFAIIHQSCFRDDDDEPTIISDDDPDQGWGKMRKEFKYEVDCGAHRCCVCEWPSEGNGGYTCECVCPVCGVKVFDDITIEDHGKCRDCHKERLNNLQPISDEELIEIAKNGYSDFLTPFPEDVVVAGQHKCGDSLADFVVIELIEGTEGEEADGVERLYHAIRLMEKAVEQIEGVKESLTLKIIEMEGDTIEETCENCNYKLNKDEPITIEGTALVHGTASLNDFQEEGIEWIPKHSNDEEWICPQCGTKNKIAL